MHHLASESCVHFFLSSGNKSDLNVRDDIKSGLFSDKSTELL